jgi:hypothetical protein
MLAAVIARPLAQAQGQGAAQTPPPGQARAGGAPKNVQVLPKDWTSQQVQGFMRTYFTVGLGVQCTYCHVQDRSSDEKKEKQTARKMLAMMMASNDQVKDVGEPAAAGSYKITCYMCHRGATKPLSAPPAGGGF